MKSAQDYLKSIHSYNKQFLQAFTEVQESKFDTDDLKISDVIIAGMGGSSFGGRVAVSVFEPFKLLAPIKLVQDYYLPAYADEKTLVVLDSYSGATEEVLSIKQQAIEKGCQIFAITNGKHLAQSIKSKEIAGYIFDAKHNPIGLPRTGIGYNVGAILGLLSKTKLLNFSLDDAEEVSSHIVTFTRNLQETELVNKITGMIKNKIPIFFSAEHAYEGAYIWRNFMNETAKHVGFVLPIPSLNHHFLDGLRYPDKFKNSALVIYVESPLYNGRTEKRFEITRQITQRYTFPDITVNLGGKGRLHDLWETVVLGSLVSFKLAQFHKVNPATNEEVNFLKKALGSLV